MYHAHQVDWIPLWGGLIWCAAFLLSALLVMGVGLAVQVLVQAESIRAQNAAAAKLHAAEEAARAAQSRAEAAEQLKVGWTILRTHACADTSLQRI